MSDAESAEALLGQIRRVQAFQEHMDRLGAGRPNPCADLTAAARAVVAAWDQWSGERYGVGSVKLVAPIAALRAALEEHDAD